MQVLSCQRAPSLIPLRKPSPAGADASRRRAPSMLSGRRGDRGFTLIELMVTVTIAVILLMIAVPSFKNITLSNKLTTSANDIVHAISVARMEAVKRNASTQLCSDSSSANSSNTLGAGCGTKVGAVYAISNGTANPVLASPSGLVAPLKLKGNMTALRFSPQGLAQEVGATPAAPFSGTVADICTSQMSSGNHRLITMTAGSILVTTTTSGSCP